jgi:hypothetical protein
MPTPSLNKQALDAVIGHSLSKSHSHVRIVRELYLAPNVYALADDTSSRNEILEAIRYAFNVPYTHIHINGSAKTGYSYYKARDFIRGESDLDVAIIDSGLFCRYQEEAVRVTENYRNLTPFPVRQDIPDVPTVFQRNVAIGYIRPDLLPQCQLKTDFLNFFQQLSSRHLKFKSISAAVFLSERLFELKQADLIKKYNELK